MLRGECRLRQATELYPGFEGTVAAVSALPPPVEGHHYSRSDRLAMAAARDAVKDLSGFDLRESGIVMASTVAGLTEIEPEISTGCIGVKFGLSRCR